MPTTTASQVSPQAWTSTLAVCSRCFQYLMAQRWHDNTNASSVEDYADTFSEMSSMGIEKLQMNISSDSELSATSALIGNADEICKSTSLQVHTPLLTPQAIDGIDMNIGCIGNLSSTASVGIAPGLLSHPWTPASDATGLVVCLHHLVELHPLSCTSTAPLMEMSRRIATGDYWRYQYGKY